MKSYWVSYWVLLKVPREAVCPRESIDPFEIIDNISKDFKQVHEVVGIATHCTLKGQFTQAK